VTRRLKLSEVRTSRRGAIVAAPAWAFVKKTRPVPDDGRLYRCSYFLEPVESAWVDVLESIRCHREAEYERKVKEHGELMERVRAGTLTDFDRWRMSLGSMLGEDPTAPPIRRSDRPPRFTVSDRRGSCVVCRQDYYGRGSTRYCSDGCFKEARRNRPRPSRAKDPVQVACVRCGVCFVPTRKDARYCSVRCRVAAHRTKESNA
jgi:hypothetical protein